MKEIALNLLSSLEKYLLSVFIIGFSLFPLTPNIIKGLPVVIFALIALVYLIFKKASHKNYTKYGIIFSSIFLFYFLSLLYTNNIGYGLKKIETTASLFIIPLCFTFIYQRVKIRPKFKVIFIHAYIWSSAIYASSILWYFYYLGFQYCQHNLSHCLSYLDGMFILSEHPIYASMFIALGVIFISNNILKQATYIKIIYTVFLLLFYFILFLLMRKGVLLALMASFIGFFIFNRKNIKINYFILTISICTVFTLTLNFKESIYKRFSEIVMKDTYQSINQNNSTSIRHSIYKCSLIVISESPLIGYGIGDATDTLVNCYMGKSNLLVNERYNSHNQFLAITLYIGLIGLGVFIWQLVLYLKNAISNKDIVYFQVLLFFIFLFLTENILDRQSGVILFSFIANFFFFNNLSNKHN